MIIEFADKYMCICNNGENSKHPMHAASQYVTMVARLRGFVAGHSTWQIRSRHCKGSSLSSIIIDHWLQRLSQSKRCPIRRKKVRNCTALINRMLEPVSYYVNFELYSLHVFTNGGIGRLH